ncbi:MAG TPA: glycoside hydrolase family 3 N-terminal domain-containing protein [Cellulomonas sp.]
MPRPAYRDPWSATEQRVDDLLARLTLPEKAGLLFHAIAVLGDVDAEHPELGAPSLRSLIEDRHLTHFNVLGTARTGAELARWSNSVQEVARGTRLGVPVTLSSDPRHAFTRNPGTGQQTAAFSQWPEPLGLAALRERAVTAVFAQAVREEYLATGLRVALHPQLDVATEPRWARVAGTFGEDAALVARLGAAYVRGLQGPVLGPGSVAAMIKHFPGGGPQQDGEDPHFAYGKEQVYPGGMFEHHLRPFEVALAAGASQVMPYYGVPVGTEHEEVAFAFNRSVLTGLLRERLGFDGIVCTDWGVLTDGEILGTPMPAQAWGVEHLSLPDRVLRALDAGVDQFGGESCPEVVVELVRSGRLAEERVDVSARRLLREKVVLGLLDDPLVDVARASRVVGSPRLRAAGLAAQRASLTVLTRGAVGSPARLPLDAGARVHSQGIDPGVLARYARPADVPADADVAVVRLTAPYEDRGPGFEGLFHAGSLEFGPEVLEPLRALCAEVPTVVVVHLDRPAVLTPVVAVAAAVLVDYGAGDDAVLDVVFGRAAPHGRLPCDLPRSGAAVAASRADVPFDTERPLFRAGHGLVLD